MPSGDEEAGRAPAGNTGFFFFKGQSDSNMVTGSHEAEMLGNEELASGDKDDYQVSLCESVQSFYVAPGERACNELLTGGTAQGWRHSECESSKRERPGGDHSLLTQV